MQNTINQIDTLDLDQHDKAKVEYLLTDGIVETLEDAIEKYNDVILYDVDSYSDLARDFVNDGIWGDTKTMGNLVNYIDYESLGRDLSYEGYTTFDSVILCKTVIAYFC